MPADKVSTAGDTLVELAQVLEDLCGALELELERQENTLEVCRAQRQAAMRHDIEYLEANTAALETLVRETIAAEAERHRLFRHVVDYYQLPEEQQTLTALIEVAPEPWSGRMRYFQGQLQGVLGDSREAVGGNQRVLRRSLKVIYDALQMVSECRAPEAGHYDADGLSNTRVGRAASVIDQKG